MALVACSGPTDESEPPPVTRATVPEVSASDGSAGVFTPAGGSDVGSGPSTTANADDATRGDDPSGSDQSPDTAGESDSGSADRRDGTGGADDTAAESDVDSTAGRGSADGPDGASGSGGDYSIAFEQLGPNVEGGWMTVPLDYSDPDGDSLKLWVTRQTSTSDKRIGILLTNNGGPGVAASSMALSADAYFENPLLEYFDIISWDPRGTGISGGSVDCIDDDEYDTYFGASDITPENDAEREELVRLSRRFAQSCIDAVGADLLPHLGTNNSARDMDAIRQALGEVQASYLGYSYGSELGAVWATLFPNTVRSAVLDGAAHPDPDGVEPLKRQQLGFERVFDTFLEECSENPECVFHNDGDAQGAYDRLLEQLDEAPAPGPAGRNPANQEVLTGAVIQAMFTDRRWPALERALADAAVGDGTGLLAFYDSYFRRDPGDGTYPNLIESFQAITCADQADRPTPAQADRKARELVGIAPRVFPSTTGGYTCGFFPESSDPRIEITGERAGPIVVIGTTGDPTTPLKSSSAMADALEGGVLVTVDAQQHTAYRSGECINDIVHQYLIWLEPPAPDTRCP